MDQPLTTNTSTQSYIQSRYTRFQYNNIKIQTHLTTTKELFNDPPTEPSHSTRFLSLFKNDPKPLFDHVRNAGIAAAIIFAANTLSNQQSAHDFINPFLLDIATIGLSIGGALLLIYNGLFAQNVIQTIMRKNKTNKTLPPSTNNLQTKNPKKINIFIANALALIYYFLIFSLIAPQFLNSFKKETEQNNEQYLNIGKVISTVTNLSNENKILKDKIQTLTDKYETTSPIEN